MKLSSINFWPQGALGLQVLNLLVIAGLGGLIVLSFWLSISGLMGLGMQLSGIFVLVSLNGMLETSQFPTLDSDLL